MEKDINIDLRDSYIEIQCGEKQIAQFEEDKLNGKITFELITKPLPLPKHPVKSTKKNLRKNLRQHVEIIRILFI